MRFLYLLFLTISISSQASETDQFTARHLGLPADGSSLLNQEMNRRLDLALLQLNGELLVQSGRYCGNAKMPTDIQKALSKNLRRIFYGQVEGWIQDNETFPKVRFALNESIYRELGFFNSPPLFLPKVGFGPTVNINGFAVGTDKIGHFLDEGYTLNSIFEKKHDLQKAFAYSKKTESGFFGLVTTGVYSYADTVANYQGLKFWQSMLGQDNNPFFRCENVSGHPQLHRIRDFDISDYVDSAWDESINCSKYRNARFAANIERQVRAMGQTCPITPPECQTLRKKYAGSLSFLLSPICK